MPIFIQHELFNPGEVLARFEGELVPGEYGAQVSFVGTLRDFNEAYAVRSMELEHYPGMTERALDEICRFAQDHWALIEVLVVHRVGAVIPGEPIVLVSVWSAHRSNAFDACRYIINELKERAPFWKREVCPEGSRWVEKNTSDIPNV